MVSMSCPDLLSLCSSTDLTEIRNPIRPLPRVVTSPTIITGQIWDPFTDSDNSDSSPPPLLKRKIIVANFLPLISNKDPITNKWSFSLDKDSILVQLTDGFCDGSETVYVGSLKADIDPIDQDYISHILFKNFKCIPTFLNPDLFEKYYHGFCKQFLWPLFHYMLPICLEKGELFDRTLFQAYVSANKIFADKIMEGINSDDDFVWVHDYHLMLVPTFLRKKLNRVKLGFFLHSPFPSSEIYRTLPVREEILKSLLNADLIGFQTFDYARHFLSCCSRMLGLDYESKRGYIGIEYFGRTVSIKILSVGVHVGRLKSVLNEQKTVDKIEEIKNKFEGKTIILGVDDMDIFKGISLKLLGFEILLERNPKLRGKVVLVQIVNPARSTGKDVQEARKETGLVAKRINSQYGLPGYDPLVLIEDPVPFYEKIAYYASSEYCIVNAVRDGMNLVPYEYIICRQGTENPNANPNSSNNTSTLIVSEFVGCSPSLSGAYRVNPWSVDDVADALYRAINLSNSEKQMRHEKHYKYVDSHHVAYWAKSFMQDLERACKDHYNRRCWAIGFGLGFRIVALQPGFRKLSLDHVASVYKKSVKRAIFLDYDGTLVPESSISKTPGEDVIAILNNLCADPKNTVFIVSGRGRDSLDTWFSSCNNLGIAAEHGYFIRWNKESEWETSAPLLDSEWKRIVEPVMKLYMETTDGSTIEPKESALVWHHQYADHDFGSCQAKELLNHLESVLANEPVMVKRGQQIVEVKPQGVSKGLVVEKLMQKMVDDGNAPDFLMCIGDDRSDEDMFECINKAASSDLFPVGPEVFACAVGQKPTKAKYYVDDESEVVRLLKGISVISSKKESGFKGKVSFKMPVEGDF